MPVRITLRIDENYSPFRDMLKFLINSPLGDSLLICSGYIQEGLWNFNILKEDLLDAIKDGCSQGEVITVAGKLSDPQWKNSYINFIRGLEKAGIKVTPCIAPELNWHAKIAMRLAGSPHEPIAALIGSSNLTRPSWAQSKDLSWNFEGDVLLWIDVDELNSHFGSQYQPRVRFGDLRLVLDERVPQHNEKEQLRLLYDHIRHSGITRFKV